MLECLRTDLDRDIGASAHDQRYYTQITSAVVIKGQRSV